MLNTKVIVSQLVFVGSAYVCWLLQGSDQRVLELSSSAADRGACPLFFMPAFYASF
jgi:hypothetical protein